MLLDDYKKKRDFEKTSEPKARKNKKDEKRFVIQEHWASNHHFDFRLELEGVLKSWAVPKGVPEKEGIKRLAIQTEDHPVDYINFSGEIAEGQYGAGKVEIFDKGKFELIEKEEEKMTFFLEGTRIKGEYALIKIKEPNQWLIFKKS